MGHLNRVFRAAPEGRHSGALVLRHAGRRVVVLVLPKVWRDGPPGHHRVDLPAGAAATVVSVHEGDTLEFDGEDAFGEAALRRLGRGDDRSPLLRPGVARPHDAARIDGGLDDLLRLVSVSRRGRAAVERPVDAARERPGSLLAPLLYASFLDEVEESLRSVRRGYVERTERLGYVRGRIVASDLGRHLATGEPTLTCTFDEFVAATPLMRVVAGALEVVGGRGESDLGRLLGGGVRVSSRARRLRRALAGVEAYPRSQGASIGARLRLSRLDRPWAAALSLTVTILRGNELEQREGARGDGPALHLEVWTEKIWEDALRDGLRTRIGFGGIRAVRDGNASSGGVRAPAPFRRVDRVQPFAPYRPDLVVEVLADDGPGLVVVDAKYIQRDADAGADRAHLDQMFAYSHLTRTRGLGGAPVTRTVLAYAGPSPAPVGSYRRSPDGLPLEAVALPFPRPADAASPAAWGRYLKRLGTSLEAVVSPPPSAIARGSSAS